MRHRRSLAAVALILSFTAAIALPAIAGAQAQTETKAKKKKADSLGTPKPKKVDSIPPPLFTSETPLAVTFTTNFRQLRGDKGQTSPWRSATIAYSGSDGKSVTIPIKAKTHGIWRLAHCDIPPIRFNVSNKDAKGTLFHDIQKPKVVNACRDRANYEQLLLQEMQLYRIYQVLTPVSHRVRTLRVTYVDSASGKQEAIRHAFLFEDPGELAGRFGGEMLKTKGAGPDDLDPTQAAIVFLFQFMIGNTDFSFNGLHNGELIFKPDGMPLLPVAYDFDFSGAVNAPYATVDPRLAVKRVRDRQYRGYCVLKPEIPAAIALFQQKKEAIYALYRDDIGKLLEERIVKETLEYFDDFYNTIKSERDAERGMLDSCVGPR